MPTTLLPTVATPVLVVFPKDVEAFAPIPKNEPPPPTSLWLAVCFTVSLVRDAADIMLTVDCCNTRSQREDEII